MSDYLKRKFEKHFSRGLAMWTSEDGTLMALAITTRIDWPKVLQFEFSHILTTEGEGFESSRAKLKYAHWGWAEPGYFDGGTGRTHGKVWTIDDDDSGFPVMEYELRIPR